MNEPTPTQAVLRLVEAGWSESRIAKEVGTSQPTIHRIKHGQRSVAFEIGTALVRLAAASQKTSLISECGGHVFDGPEVA
ncbi:helix-turn-helix domain-containing protein [Xanthomonas arboricola]|uniref:helix-turn-helix domain-containing protein n=1 Tax=Xanthomonas arboricola TaxID=56448 RepID=UPI001618D252|nr:helix-turn-helix domain-containing protein [Xanthomonas arboricola]MBB4726373.1 transcriptional regulator with XRE-family HTH domain [Xanthomonas arboricola]WIX23729.1 helix-turn-helix domain-containing protein [Xanthomonas arboricola pv. corylina]